MPKTLHTVATNVFSLTAENEMDNVYFSANYKSVETTSFDLSYQQVDFESGGGVSTSRLHGWQEGDSAWLNSE